jgi:hypothetical protein
LEPAGVGEEIGRQPAEYEGLNFGSITSLALNSMEDTLFFLSDNNQIMKVNVALDGSPIEKGERLF